MHIHCDNLRREYEGTKEEVNTMKRTIKDQEETIEKLKEEMKSLKRTFEENRSSYEMRKRKKSK